MEDERSAARYIAKGLREATYAVDVASDGNAAARQYEQNDYDAFSNVVDVYVTSGPGGSIFAASLPG